MLREGDLLAGKYRIEHQLGQGGMGYVLAAMHEQLQQRVAIKFLSAEQEGNPDAAARFMREARAAVRIQNEHVARVIDVAELSDGSPYMVMEFLSGTDLSDELQAQGRFAVSTAVDYVLQACEAVAEAHTLGLVHRDLKPANLFLTTRADGSPLVKVLDFGISKAMASSLTSASLTSAKAMLGSPAYMSPEQARAPKMVDVRTDIWSLGVILFEFLSGRLPFTGDTPLSVVAATFIEPTPSLCALQPDLSPEVAAVVERCLQKKPEDRYQTVAELAQALAPFAERHSLTSVARIQGTILRPSSSPPPMSQEKPSLDHPGVHAETQPDERPHATVVAHSGTADTVMDWGKSQVSDKRSWRVAALLGAGGVVVLVLSRLFGGTPAKVEVPAAAASQPETVRQITPEPAPRPSMPLPVASSVPAGKLAPPTTPSVSVAPRGTHARPQPRPAEPIPVKPAALQPGGTDPLEGRR